MKESRGDIYFSNYHLEKKLSSSLSFQNSFITLEVGEEEAHREITQSLLIEFKNNVEKAGGTFVAAILSADDEVIEDYQRFAEDNGLRIVDCVDPAFESGKFPLHEARMPTAETHSVWANCIGKIASSIEK